jgi:hypothetical protein
VAAAPVSRHPTALPPPPPALLLPLLRRRRPTLASPCGTLRSMPLLLPRRLRPLKPAGLRATRLMRARRKGPVAAAAAESAGRSGCWTLPLPLLLELLGTPTTLPWQLEEGGQGEGIIAVVGPCAPTVTLLLMSLRHGAAAAAAGSGEPVAEEGEEEEEEETVGTTGARHVAGAAACGEAVGTAAAAEDEEVEEEGGAGATVTRGEEGAEGPQLVAHRCPSIVWQVGQPTRPDCQWHQCSSSTNRSSTVTGGYQPRTLPCKLLPLHRRLSRLQSVACLDPSLAFRLQPPPQSGPLYRCRHASRVRVGHGYRRKLLPFSLVNYSVV